MLALCVVVLSACTAGDSGEDDAAATTIPEASTLLRVASAEWPSCLNPVACDDAAARSLVLQHVLPKLMEVDADGEYVPGPVLARAPEVQLDPDSGEQTVVYRLSDDARWHDGRPITSSDVTATWLAHRDTPGAPDAGHSLITAVDDTDPLVARVTLSRPWSDWPELFGGHRGWLLQADALGGTTDLSGSFEDELPFGAGPYELVAFDDRSLVLVARETHWSEARQPEIDQVRIEYVSGLSEDGAVVPGGIDVALAGWVVDEVPSGFRQRFAPTTEIVGLMLDRRTPPLGSQAVRTAVDEAIDREDSLELLPQGADVELVTCLSGLPQQPVCLEDDLLEPGTSADAANFLLQLDGWALDPTTGTRARPGLALSTEVSFDPAVTGAGEIADAAAARLAEFGFATEVRSMGGAEWFERSRAEGTGVGVFAVPLATASQWAAFLGCGADGMNPLGWCEPELQALVDELLRSPDADARVGAQQALGSRSAESMSWLPLYQRTTPWLVAEGRVDVPSDRPLGTGPLGALHDFVRTD